MTVGSTKHLVVEILSANQLSFDEETDELQLRFSSSLVSIGFDQVGEQVIIEMRSQVLREVPDFQAKVLELLRALNELNLRSRFGKWVADESRTTVALEYDLLGDHLQEEEFMTALAMIARLADREDDLLQTRFGGKKAFEQ